MEKEGTAPALIEERQIANGMTVSLYDESKALVGDRWMVQLTCKATAPILKEQWDGKKEESLEVSARLRRMMGDTLVFSVSKVRNFISSDERQAALSELIEQIRENMMAYVGDPNFPQKLFEKHYRETKEKILQEDLRRRMTGQADKDDGLLNFPSYTRK